VPADRRLSALGFAASRATAMSPRLSQFRWVHLATHGLINSVHPEMSGLVLSLVGPDGRPRPGFLSALDVLDLDLRADLVVLSACRTALGKEVRGEGLLGLTRAFMQAGAPRVVASYWRVDDAATAALMARFYRGLLGPAPLRPAAALRRAQLEMREQARWRHPYYWAAFALHGEWR
jgi:CHAT domain-containing protein